MNPNPAIYDEETSTASAEPSSSVQLLVFKRLKATILPEHCQDLEIFDESRDNFILVGKKSTIFSFKYLLYKV
ncbi:hypothetical protein T11_5544 [Trichinella zimbabwensis]|uniref:Uncharacterized protein n=1 Tax=Trichinella zimbabwensis TaxID=268475 RepID=A0A0V1H715_9BILA|nr:hypothetical protein T11_5544 [Trichinella zimbabwensis]